MNILNSILEIGNNPYVELALRIIIGIAFLCYALLIMDWTNRIFHRKTK